MKHAILIAATVGAILCTGGVGVALGTTQVATPASPTAVAEIAHGQWQLREIGSGAAPLSLCVTDPSTLLQIEHRQAHCNHFIVSDQPRAATVSYNCAGSGNGRTTIKLESANDFRLDTQGIMDGAPFDKGYMAHRTGDCGTAAR